MRRSRKEMYVICFSEMQIQCITIETNTLNCYETLFRQKAYPLLDVEY